MNIRQRVTALAQRLEATQRPLGELDRSVVQADRHADSCESEFQDAWWPVRRAQRDTVRADVSFEGHQIGRNFDDGQRQAENADRELLRGERELNSLMTEARTIQAEFDQLLQEVEGDEKTALRRAQNEFQEGHGQLEQLDGHWNRADSKLEGVAREARRADFDIREIQRDAVGRDVSHSATWVSSSLRRIEWDVRDAQNELGWAQEGIDDAETSFLSAAGILRDIS